MVAAVCSWHVHHTAAAGEIEKRLATGRKMAVASHALVEAYAVLTRLPPPYRLAPKDAYAILKANFVTGRRIVSLDAAGITDLLSALAYHGIGGGQTYDAVIATCARRAKASELLTFNAAHFEPSAAPPSKSQFGKFAADLSLGSNRQPMRRMCCNAIRIFRDGPASPATRACPPPSPSPSSAARKCDARLVLIALRDGHVVLENHG